MKRIQVASKSKRILSSLIDLAIIGGLFTISYLFIFIKAVGAVQNFEAKNQIILEEKIKSGLFTSDGSKTVYEANPNIKYDELEKHVKKYYSTYLYSYVKDPSSDIKYSKYWYAVTILRLPDDLKLFKEPPKYNDDERPYKWVGTVAFDNPTYEPRLDKFEVKDIQQFISNSFGTAVSNFTLNDVTPVKAAVRVVSFGTMRALLYSSMFSTFIPCFIVPISLKNGKTVGKLVTGLIVLTDEGYEYKRYKHIFRYLSFYFVEFFGGVLTIGITFILSTCLVLFSKKHKALHDYIAFSCVADEKHTVFYKDIDEENEYKNKNITELTLE